MDNVKANYAGATRGPGKRDVLLAGIANLSCRIEELEKIIDSLVGCEPQPVSANQTGAPTQPPNLRIALEDASSSIERFSDRINTCIHRLHDGLN